MLDMQILKQVFIFLFGQPHEAMYTAATLTALVFGMYFLGKYDPPKTKRQILRLVLERGFAYLAFLILANRIDQLAVDKMFEWQGATQFVVCMYIIGKKGKIILNFIRARGIEVPGVLDSRLDNMHNAGGAPQPLITPDALTSKLKGLKDKMTEAESKQEDSFPEEDNRGGE